MNGRILGDLRHLSPDPAFSLRRASDRSRVASRRSVELGALEVESQGRRRLDQSRDRHAAEPSAGPDRTAASCLRGRPVPSETCPTNAPKAPYVLRHSSSSRSPAQLSCPVSGTRDPPAEIDVASREPNIATVAVLLPARLHTSASCLRFVHRATQTAWLPMGAR